MPKPKPISPNREVKVYLTQANFAQLELLCYSEALGKKVYGEQNKVVNAALEAYFKELKNVQR